MADVTLTYKGSDILELSNSGSATLKTGGKYCEDDIAVEYVKPSGGGGSCWELLADHTTTEDVSSIQIDFTSAMQGYDYYSIVLEGQFTGDEYPCPAFNSEPATSKYIPKWTANTTDKAFVSVVPVKSPTTGVLNYKFEWTNTSGSGTVSMPISYFKVAVYYSQNYFKTGFNVKVYGVMMP